MPSIKGSCMGLEKNDFPTGIVLMIPEGLCNFLCYLDVQSIGGIRTWTSEGILLIT